MVELIVGKKGKGKTKVLLDRVNGAVKEANGSIVYLDKSTKHMYGREDYLLRNWQCGSYTEFFEYLRCYWTGTEYWYASSFCKLWSDFPGQLVYWYGACDECRSAEQYL